MTATTTPHGIPLPAALSCVPAKRDYYGSDVYYLESAEQLAAMLAVGAPDDGDLIDFAYAHALVLLKPDAVVSRQLLPAIDWLNDRGFRIVAAGRSRLTGTVARALWHYQWNLSTGYRRRLADGFASSTDSLVLVVRPRTRPEVPASVLLTELKGPTNPEKRTPGQLRFVLGRYCYLLNLVHTADEPADVLRELAIYFGTGERAAVYADALRGLDRQDRARELARALYAEAPARDLDFRPAAERLVAAAEDMLAADGLSESLREPLRAALTQASAGLAEGSAQAEAATWRPLFELFWRHDLAFDLWDATTVGAYVFPMRRPGFAPVLDGVSSADWRQHLATGLRDSNGSNGSNGRPRVEFARTVDRESAHRRTVSEVFVTSASQVDARTFDLGTQIPRQHGYFSDHRSHVAYDPMFFVEACRQGGYVIAHRFLGAPHDHPFILRHVELDVTEPELLGVREAPTEVWIRCRVERNYRDRNGHNTGVRLHFLAHVDERAAVSCRLDSRWVSPEQWATLRGDGAGLVASVPPRPRGPRLPAEALGRWNPGNVVISPPSPPARAEGPDLDPGLAWTTEIVIDTRHPTLFDHPLDHIPGLLQLEAMRQLASVVTVPTGQGQASPVRLTGLDVRFTAFGELGLSASCLAWPPDRERAGSGTTFRCAVRQAGSTITAGWVRFGPAPDLTLAREQTTAGADLGAAV